MTAIYAALVLTLLPATTPPNLVRVDWSRAFPAESEIAALRGAYAAAVNAADAARASSLYTPDALTALCDGTLVRGAAAVGSRVTERTPAHASVTLRPHRFTTSGNLASETGSFVETLEGPDGPVSVEGAYVAIYSRRSGHWRIALEIRTTGHAPALAVW